MGVAHSGMEEYYWHCLELLEHGDKQPNNNKKNLNQNKTKKQTNFTLFFIIVLRFSIDNIIAGTQSIPLATSFSLTYFC